MNTLKVTIESIGYCAISSGSEKGIIDSALLTSVYGFPEINGRRFKGLLREAAQETLEILQINSEVSQSLLTMVFGQVGGYVLNKPVVYFPGLQMSEAVDFEKDYPLLKSEEKAKLSPKNILNQYAGITQKTAINPETGVAKIGSLRNIEVLNPGVIFTGDLLLLGTLPAEGILLLKLAALQLSRSGTARNKGLGEIKCTISETKLDARKPEEFDFENCINKLKNYKPGLTTPSTVLDNKRISVSTEMNTFFYTLELETPIVITRQKGEQNTVNTAMHPAGQMLRGAFIQACFRYGGFDAELLNSLLCDTFTWSAALPYDGSRDYIPVPFAWQKRKMKGTLRNLWATVPANKEDDDPTLAYPDEMYAGWNNGEVILKQLPLKTSFHHSRFKSRLAGKSLETDKGSIFYYQSIQKGTCFAGSIRGSASILEYLKNTLKDGSWVTLGRSSGTEYGLAKLSWQTMAPETEEIRLKAEDHSYQTYEFAMVAVSPLLLLNPFGFGQPSVDLLKKELEESLDLPVDEVSAIAKSEFLSSYSALWQSRSGRQLAYSAGSCFKVTLIESTEWFTISKALTKNLGSLTEYGLGKMKLLPKPLQPKETGDFLVKIAKRENRQVLQTSTIDLLNKIKDKKNIPD